MPERIFFVVGFFALSFGICLLMDAWVRLRKKYKVRKRKQIYAYTNDLRKQFRSENRALIRDKLIIRPGSMRNVRPDRLHRLIDV